jgi:hypothetical protein
MNRPELLDDNSPGWRWDVITALTEENRPLSRNISDVLVRQGYHFFKRYNKAKTRIENLDIKADYPDVYRAYNLYSDWSSEKWLIEAGILTGEPTEKICEWTGHKPETVETYQSLFYDIRDRLKARGFILNRVMMPAVNRGMHARDYDLLLKMLAYCGGWNVFTEFLDGANMSDGTRQWLSTNFSDKLLKQGWVAVHRLEVNNFNSVEVINTIVKLKEIEALKGGPGGAHQQALTALSQLLDQCVTTIMPGASPVFDMDEPRALEMVAGQTVEKYLPTTAGGPV